MYESRHFECMNVGQFECINVEQFECMNVEQFECMNVCNLIDESLFDRSAA
jgi:hypothetical protein